jgi:hypothetical protein
MEQREFILRVDSNVLDERLKFLRECPDLEVWDEDFNL